MTCQGLCSLLLRRRSLRSSGLVQDRGSFFSDALVVNVGTQGRFAYCVEFAYRLSVGLPAGLAEPSVCARQVC